MSSAGGACRTRTARANRCRAGRYLRTRSRRAAGERRRRDRAAVAGSRAQRRRDRRPDRRRAQQGEPGTGVGAQSARRAAAARSHGRPASSTGGWVLVDVVTAGLARTGRLRGANAWLDGLVAWRRASGLPATTINWGQWSDIGVARSLTFSALDPDHSGRRHRGAGGHARRQPRPDRGGSPATGSGRGRIPGDSATRLLRQRWPRNWISTATTTIGPAPTRCGRWIPPRPTGSSPRDCADGSLAIMGYPKDSTDRCQPAVDRTGDGFPDGRADPKHRSRRLRRGAAGGPAVAGRLAGRLTTDLIRQLGLDEQKSARDPPTEFVIEPSNVPQPGSEPRRGER